MKEYKGIINKCTVNEFTVIFHNREIFIKKVIITYYKDNKFFARWIYRNLNKKKIEKIKETLSDYVEYNCTVECQCQALPLVTMVHEVEKIVFS